MNGKGKEYYNDGILNFEGEYLNNERNGNGKEYYEDGKLNLKENIKIVIEMEKEKNIIIMEK